jgi:hypothetical protein
MGTQSWLVGGLLVVAATMALAGPSATLTVNNDGDAGDGTCTTVCTLRDAIANVAPGGTIDFDPAILPATIALQHGALTLSKSVRIAGPGAEKLAISATASSRAITITFGPVGNGDVAIADLTIRDGALIGDNGSTAAAGTGTSGGPGSAALGGCVRVISGSLVLERVAIRNCLARGGDGGNGGSGVAGTGLSTGGTGGTGGPGAAALGGAIEFVGTGDLTLRATSIASAYAIGGKGGAAGDGGTGFLRGKGGHGGYGGAGQGGALFFEGNFLTVINTTFSSATASAGSGGNGGAGDPGLATSTGGDGGDAGDAAGGLIAISGATPVPPAIAQIDFTTAAEGTLISGAGGNGGAGATPGATGGTSTPIGAVIAASGFVTMNSSAFAKAVGAPTCYGPVTPAAGSANLGDDVSCNTTLHASLASAFRPLSDAPLPAYRPVFGSVVIDAAASCNDSSLLPVSDDEQSIPRPQGGACDIGAIEADYIFVGDFD